MPRCVLHHAVAAIPDDKGNADGPDEIDKGKKYRIVEYRIDVRAAVVLVNDVKPMDRLRLSVEDLHSLRAGKMFL